MIALNSYSSVHIPLPKAVFIVHVYLLIITPIIESVDSICRDSADTQYMLIQTNFSKSPKQLTYKLL